MMLPENENWPKIMGRVGRVIGPGDAPTRQNLPFGRNMPSQNAQSRSAVAVEISASRRPLASFIASRSGLMKQWCAPNRRALPVCPGWSRTQTGSHSPRKLHREVAQSADANDAHAPPGLDQAAERGVNGDAGAKQRRRHRGVQRIRDGNRETAVCPNAPGKTAEARQAGRP